ncbi:hypothetical protein ACFE04_004238 [Oxalis oulophora]
MGFDNECILTIQSLPGEYFCPVCRLLVYPTEALQSLCTHLYCNQCLTYVVSTTQACPYDGYLVTVADSKPLVESNKVLAETIGKVMVRCLFHRSGCTWQGSLSECTIHCSGCAFGNSPVICNRCGVQIVHSQVQEHAQTCTGVQPTQVQQQAVVIPNVAATNTTANSDKIQPSTQAGKVISLASIPNNVVSSAAPQTQVTVQSQTAVPTPEQWYQQHQQIYQQYYQQYPGFDLYQQQYQQKYAQAYLQTQAQSNAPVAGQPQSQTPVNPQQNATTTLPLPQMETLTQPTSLQTGPNPPAQTNHVKPYLLNVQMAHHQQSLFQHASQLPNSNTQLQTVHLAAQVLPGHHSHSMQHNQHQMQASTLQNHMLHIHGGTQLPFQPPVQMQNQHPPRQLSQLHPSATTLPKQQATLSTQQPIAQQFVQQQQPIAGHPPGVVQNQIPEQGPFVQSQLRPLGLPYSFHQHSAPYHPQNTVGRLVMENHEVQSQSHPPSAASMKIKQNQVQLSNQQQSVANTSEKRAAESFQKMDKKDNRDPVSNENQPVGEAKNISTPVDATTEEHVAENSDLMINGRVKEDSTYINKDHKSAPDIDHKQLKHSLSKDVKNQDGSLPKTALKLDEHSRAMQNRNPVDLPSSFEQTIIMKMNARPGSNSLSNFGLGDKRFNSLSNEIERERDFEDHRRDPKTYHVAGPGFGMDTRSKLDPMGGPVSSRFPPPSYHFGGPAGRLDSGHDHPHFLGPDVEYRRHMEDLTAGRSSREFGRLSGRPGLDDHIVGRGPRHFGDFHEPPFFSRHFHRDEFETPGNMRTGEHLRNGDFFPHDIAPSHLQRRERFSPRLVGFDEFPGQGRMREFPPTRLVEPGLRSNIHFLEFPNDIYRGAMKFSDKSRKRKSLTMGWCRICKIDCDTIEGLELHSQTRGHQQMAMDMVAAIKQNAKKHKIHSGERSSLEGTSKLRNVSLEGHGSMRGAG